MATTAKNEKYVYSFGGGKADGNESMKNLLGGKGANLAEMAGHKDLKLPVPPGFTITEGIHILFIFCCCSHNILICYFSLIISGTKLQTTL